MVSSSRDQGKATKGSVQIKNSNDRLRLVFSHAGKRRYLSFGFEDSIQNRKLAELRARQIELDLLSGNFDESLVKYKPESAPRTVTPGITPITPEAPALPSLDFLWEKYTEYKRPSLSPSTLAKDFIYGRGFSRQSLFHRIRFAEVFSEEEIVSTLSRQLSWSHFLKIIYLKEPLQRDFYVELCRIDRWSGCSARS